MTDRKILIRQQEDGNLKKYIISDRKVKPCLAHSHTHTHTLTLTHTYTHSHTHALHVVHIHKKPQLCIQL